MDSERSLQIWQDDPLDLSGYARVSIAYRVSEIFDVAESQRVPGDFEVSLRGLRDSYLKDYDQGPGGGPGEWRRCLDLKNWGIFGAYSGGERLGAAAVAFDTPGLELLEERRDLAVLWDIRVDPRARGRGVGLALFCAAERWASARACRSLKIETQNTNVPACRFYLRQGCVLRKTQRAAYPEFPHEVQMLWYKRLTPDGQGPR